MQLIKPSVELVTEPDLMKKLELIGRVCWASEDRITDNSAEKFVNMLINHKTESVLEHSNIVIRTNGEYNTYHLREILDEYEAESGLPSYIRNCGSDLPEYKFCDDIWSGNVRAWRSIAKRYRSEIIIEDAFWDHPLFKDIGIKSPHDYLFDERYFEFENEPAAEIIDADPYGRERHEIATFKIVCDRAIANELVRHRLLGITQRSTRYCDESNLECIEPWWWEESAQEDKQTMCSALTTAEAYYRAMQELENHSPQKSRGVLPLETATVIYLTGTVEYWKKNVLPLRTAKNAHPDIQIVAKMIEELL